jgi:hypothetical protein
LTQGRREEPCGGAPRSPNQDHRPIVDGLGPARTSAAGLGRRRLAAAPAEDSKATSVRSPPARDFVGGGAILSQAGPGLFLETKRELALRLVAETKTSKSVATQRCKRVEQPARGPARPLASPPSAA